VNNKFIKTKNHKIIIFFSKAPHTYYQWLFSIFCFPFIFKINFGFKIEFQLELSSFFTQAKKFILLSLVFSFFLVYFLIWSNNDEIWVRSECFFFIFIVTWLLSCFYLKYSTPLYIQKNKVSS
jgi:hypothetical protein